VKRNPRGVDRARGRATITKLAASFAAIAIIGAAAALTGASATPSAGPDAPTVKHLPPVAPAAFDGSVRSLPQLGARGRDIPKPRAWQEFEPFATPDKTTLPGAVEPAAAATVPNAPAPGPGSGSFAGTFAGLDSAGWGAGWPPDTNGDVGPTYFIQAVNTSIGIFKKTDGSRVAAFTFDALFSGTGTLCDNDNGGDPTVTYDPAHDRWFVADFAFTGSGSAPPFYECIAVSKTGDPVAGGWYFYAVRADDAAHPWFPDYPKMGIWPDGLYMTANMFGSSFQEVRGWAFNLDDMVSGAPLRSAVVDTNTTTYFSLLPSNTRTVAGAPPAGRPNLFVAESQTAFGLQVFKFHVDWSGSGTTFTGPTNVGHASYSAAAATAPSPANSLDTLRERLMNSAQYANLNGVESLWVNHTTRCCGTINGPAGIQWIQLNVTGGNVATTPVQQQVYPGASDGLHRWMGSVAVDKLGDMALGYSVSSATLNPDIRYAGRLAGDPLGTLPQTETSMLPGVTRGTQLGNCGGSTCTRWGDYSAMTIDPNGCDFWFTTEYYSTTGMNWQTRVGSFRLNPGCTPSGGGGGGGGGTQTQTISFDPLPDKVYGDADFRVSATASSGLPVSFAAAGNCTVSGSTVHLTGAGSCTVTASQSGDATFAPATPVSRSFAIAKAGQTISFAPLADKTFGDPDFTVSATASSGLAVSFAATGQCTVSGSTVHLTASGSCTITASQGGNTNYNAAPSLARTFTISPGQPNTGTPLTISSNIEGHLDFSTGAWANGGFHVKLSQSNASPVTVTVTGNVNLAVQCSDAAGAPVAGTIRVPVSKTLTIPAGSTSWYQTSDQKSILGWMGAVQAPNLCAGGVMHNTDGATFDVTVTAGAHSGQLGFQFHYRVPVAEGKANTDCTNANDRNHTTACQAKWSGTASI
jgi:hypothetical protein